MNGVANPSPAPALVALNIFNASIWKKIEIFRINSELSFYPDVWWRRVCFRNTQILLASNSSHTYTTRTFRNIIFHKVRKGWSELQGHSRASLHRMRCERRALCLMLHLKCAVSPVDIFLTNALRSHHLCGSECSGLIYLKYEPH